MLAGRSAAGGRSCFSRAAIAIWRPSANRCNERSELELVDQVASGEEALRSYQQHRPDGVLMDLRLQGPMDGIDAIRAICTEWPKARILVLTTYGGDESIHRLEGVARGYLTKDTVLNEGHSG